MLKPPYPFKRQRHAVPPPGQEWLPQTPSPPDSGDLRGSEAAVGSGARPRSGTGIGVEEDGDAGTHTHTQRVLTAAFEQVLGGRVDLHDNFFDLGGDSLVAAHLVRLVRQHLAVRIQVRTVFQAPTVAQLAALIDEQAGT